MTTQSRQGADPLVESLAEAISAGLAASIDKQEHIAALIHLLCKRILLQRTRVLCIVGALGRHLAADDMERLPGETDEQLKDRSNGYWSPWFFVPREEFTLGEDHDSAAGSYGWWHIPDRVSQAMRYGIDVRLGDDGQACAMSVGIAYGGKRLPRDLIRNMKNHVQAQFDYGSSPAHTFRPTSHNTFISSWST